MADIELHSEFSECLQFEVNTELIRLPLGS